MMTRSTRPIRRDLPNEILGLAHCGNPWNLRNQNNGARTIGSLSPLIPSASAFLHFSAYSARIGLLAQAVGNSSLNTSKHALTIFFLFISMMPLPGGSVEMLGASQFVNVVLFQFSGPNASLSVQTSLRSLFCDSSILSLPSSCQVDFCSAREKTYASSRSDGCGHQANDPGGRGGRL